jgi:hypothetical protein
VSEVASEPPPVGGGAAACFAAAGYPDCLLHRSARSWPFGHLRPTGQHPALPPPVLFAYAQECAARFSTQCMRVRRPQRFSINRGIENPGSFFPGHLLWYKQLGKKLLFDLHAAATHFPFRLTLRFPQGYAEKSSGLPCRRWVADDLRWVANDACAKTKLTTDSIAWRHSRIGATPILRCYREIGRKSSEIGPRYSRNFQCSRIAAS